MSVELTNLSATQADILNDAQKRREKNLQFFKSFHHQIYETFQDFKLKEYAVSLNTHNNQLDIVKNGQSIYNDRPISRAKEELSSFYEHFAKGKRIVTVPPPFSGYILPRLFHMECTELIASSPLTRNDYRGYQIPDFYPVMVFNGVGAGYHISEFLSEQKVINCLILEPEAELFAASLYTIDWEAICQPFLDDKDINIHFTIGPFKNELNMIANEMRYLSCHCPLYPLTTMFINHLGMDIYQRLTQKINEDTHAFTTVWGFYDDEIYQLNNCLHNMYANYPIIRPNLPELIPLPVFIVGGGPSLDSRIEEIQANQGRALVVSCGTAIHSLYHYGIRPDVHIELESHLVTLTSLEEFPDTEWLKDIPVIGPSQLPPRVYQFFRQKTMYFKAESVTNFLFGDKDSAVGRGTPTCTNAAIALFMHWGFKNIYLFGTDMGYRDTNDHHAKGSVYYTTKDSVLSTGAKVKEEAKLTIDGVNGAKVKTKPILYTAKRTIETCALAFKKTTQLRYCSDGATFENAEWIEAGKLDLNYISEKEGGALKQLFYERQFSKNDKRLGHEMVTDRINVLEHNIDELGNYIISEIEKIEPNIYSLTVQINHASVFLEKQIKAKIPAFYFFIRGSIWHLFYIGYSHAYCIEDEDVRNNWIASWKIQSIATMRKISKHFKKVVHKEFDIEKDPWLWVSTSEPE